jgi:RNA polymerase sigma factor for flagellar operon FliA
MSATLQDLVNEYCDSPTPALRNAIIEKSIPLVKSIVGKINRPDNALASFEDLESAGILGLLQALDNYKADQQVQFNTFAYYRIRGNIIDYLRKIDEVPRMQRTTFGKAQEIMNRLTQELGREPEDSEVAKELGVSMEDYNKLLMTVQQRSVLSLDYESGDEGSANLGSLIEDEDAEQPDARIIAEGMQIKLKDHIKQLKERDRLILALYYYEDLTLSEIAVLLGLTEARISQLVGKLLLQLRNAMSKESMH